MSTEHFIRKVKKSNYTVIDNGLLRDKRLSWKARGILCYLLHLPDDWKINLDHLKDQAADGLDSLKSGVKELQKFGYVKIQAVKDKGKILRWEWVVREEPEVEKPEVEKPQVENPVVENPTLLSTNDTNQVSKDTFTDLTNVCIVDKDILKSEICQRALKEGLDWTFPEISEAWKRYQDYPNSVSDPYRFIKGIIYNLRENQKKLDRLNKKNTYKQQPKGEKKCYTPIRKDPDTSNGTSLESSSKMSALEIWNRVAQKKKEPLVESSNGCKTQSTCLSMLGVMG